MRYAWTLVVLGMGVLSIPAHARGAQEATIPAKLTLAEALQIAEARSPRLDVARAGVDVALADRTDAARRPNPAVSVEGENYALFESSRGAFFDGQELTVRVDQEIETAGRRGLRMAIADTGVDAARAAVDDARRQVQLDVSRAYFRVVLAQAQQEIAKTALAELERVIGLTEVRVKQGETPGAELRRLRVERLRFANDVFAAELAACNARATLLGLLNISTLQQPFEAVDPLPAPPLRAQDGQVIATASGVAADLDRLREYALARRPDLRGARLQQARAETETRHQRALRTPNITVGGGYRRDFGTNALVFGVTVPVPLFNSLNPGGVERAEAERRRSDALAQAATLTVDVELQQAVNAVSINAKRVRYIEQKYLANAQQSRDIVRASYELGAADLIDFLDAQRAFRDAQRVRNQALYELRVSLIELAGAVGLSPTGQPAAPHQPATPKPHGEALAAPDQRGGGAP